MNNFLLKFGAYFVIDSVSAFYFDGRLVHRPCGGGGGGGRSSRRRLVIHRRTIRGEGGGRSVCRISTEGEAPSSSLDSRSSNGLSCEKRTLSRVSMKNEEFG